MECHHPRRLARSRREKQKASDGVHDFCDGSPSRMRRVRRISLGMTTRPKSSMRRTMPVAFIVSSPAFKISCLAAKIRRFLTGLSLRPISICCFRADIPNAAAVIFGRLKASVSNAAQQFAEKRCGSATLFDRAGLRHCRLPDTAAVTSPQFV